MAPIKALLLSSVALLATSLPASAEGSGLVVQVYEGPTDCEDGPNKVAKGDQVSMHYTGSIDQSSAAGEKGKQFDSSRDRGQTFDVVIGVGQVIKGWDQGIVGLCQGAKARLVIPPELGYGHMGAGANIPGGATLHFDVEVVSISKKPKEPNLFAELDTNKDGKLDKEEVAAYFGKGQGRHPGREGVPPELWEREDKNRDGFISWSEFGGPKGTVDPAAALREIRGDEL